MKENSTCEDFEELGAPDAKIVQTKDVDMDEPLLICGFPSAGLVGSIAANTIINQFDMEQIAFLRSKHIPSAAVFFEGRLRHPFRIYASKEKNLLVATTELPVEKSGLYEVTSCLLDWAAKQGSTETVVLDGIPVQGIPSERKVLYATEEEKMAELRDHEELDILKKGVITGIAGSILAETLTRKMIGFTFLTPAVSVIPDPEGAIKLLNIVDMFYDIDIDTTELEESAEQIKQKMREMAEQVDGMRQQQEDIGRTGYQRLYA
ncbi:MAG: proteasome assembly chaperone family protein [Promethearchaeia archaeon]